MNEPFDPLEAELLALRPQDPSPDLRERIAARLGPISPQSAVVGGPKQVTTWRRWLLISTACVVAMCVVFGAWRLSRMGGKTPVPGPAPQAPVVNAPSTLPNESERPAVVWPSGRPDRNLSATGPFVWPLEESRPMKGYAAIPADLLE
jgi:hypothetical protein